MRALLSKEMTNKPTLHMMQQMTRMGLKPCCVVMTTVRDRKFTITLWGGTATIEIEVGRKGQRMKREEKMCKECGSGATEEDQLWLMVCPACLSLRCPFHVRDGETSE